MRKYFSVRAAMLAILALTVAGALVVELSLTHDDTAVPGLEGVEPMPDASEPVTFRFFVRDPGTAPSKDNPVLQKIAELTGVTVEFEFLVGDLDRKIGMMIAGEDYPDAIFAENSRLIDAGAFIPLEELLPDYPNLYEHYRGYENKTTAPDGHMYTMDLYSVWKSFGPAFEETGAGFYIQKAVLEEAGYVIPHTLDEYFALIDGYLERHPQIDGNETVGFEILSDGWRDFCLRNAPQHLMGAGNDGDVYVDPVTWEASWYQTTDTAKNYYKKLNEEYHKGAIKAETFTQNYEEYISLISTGAVLGFFDQWWNFEQAEEALRAEGKYERTYVAVPITNEGVRDAYLDTRENKITGSNGIGITKSCKDPERLLAFLNWLMQPQVQDYLQWGVEGEDYLELEGGGRVFTQEGREKYSDQERKRDQTGYVLWYYTPKMEGLYEDGTPCGPNDSEEEFRAGLSEYDKKFLGAYGFEYPTQFLSEPVVRPEYYPVWAMIMEEGSPAKVAQYKMQALCSQYYSRLVICREEEFDSLWEEFLSAFEAAGLQPYLDEVNRQIQGIMHKKE